MNREGKVTSSVNDQVSSDRDDRADERDRAAELRDRAADRLDEIALRLVKDGEEALVLGGLYREMAASDREDAALDRLEAARERAEALSERTDSASGAQRAIDSLESRLRQTDRLKTLGQLTAGVSHDFKNLLAVIGGYAHLGQAAPADADTTSYFDQIVSTTDKAEALTRQLLVFSRRQELSPEVVDLNDVIDGLLPMLKQLLPVDVSLHLELSPRSVFVFADRSQLEQVVLNLVVNSRDAIQKRGSITIETSNDDLTGDAHDINGACGWLRVTDDGSGIPDDAMPHIFDPFFSTKPAESGTGLGLATIHGIVCKSGGSVFVDSTVGVGTKMTVALPSESPQSSPA